MKFEKNIYQDTRAGDLSLTINYYLTLESRNDQRKEYYLKIFTTRKMECFPPNYFAFQQEILPTIQNYHENKSKCSIN